MKIQWNYFLLGAVLGLVVLAYQNRDLLPETSVATQIESTLSAVMQPSATPTPYNFEGEFMKVCVEDSQNEAYCKCSADLLRDDPMWNDGRAEYLYNELKEQLYVLCMVEA